MGVCVVLVYNGRGRVDGDKNGDKSLDYGWGVAGEFVVWRGTPPSGTNGKPLGYGVARWSVSVV